jgi:hypothetical protein
MVFLVEHSRACTGAFNQQESKMKLLTPIMGALVLIGIGTCGYLTVAGELERNPERQFKSPLPIDYQSPTQRFVSSVQKFFVSSPTCYSDWRLCKDNAELFNTYWGVHNAKAACVQIANKQVTYGQPQWAAKPFDYYYNGADYPKTGRVRLNDPESRFQNGFGVYGRLGMTCIFDLNTKEVVEITATNNGS